VSTQPSVPTPPPVLKDAPLDFTKYPNGVNPTEEVAVLAMVEMLAAHLQRRFGQQSAQYMVGVNERFTELRTDVAQLYTTRTL
jgi:hypothetical protein